MYCAVELVSTALVVKPRNTVVVRGQPMELRCQTNATSNSSALSWKFTSVDGEEQRFIYDEGLDPEYRSRNVTVDMDSSSGAYHLQFQAVLLSDAGTYTCQDSAGDGMARAAWVAVLGGLFTPHTNSSIVLIINYIAWSLCIVWRY